ncbi:AMP-binding protein [Siccirubricoccus sp. KC 17139]|uniref:AMP-binding protein n=1 Tax=Siccirubricoccus soli TaxID=2899147 RepID=A0ABT1CY44_9PROT|nr:AMP-binding protein [Siccirubricoccus soli]MCO6414582.1 AMP-binding protein [Siccirubricoccus soli]MCP2680712.1 AMP-binding protein [Siccirubricoccus soli]
MPQLAYWVERQPEKIAAHFPELGAAVTYAALYARARRAAQWLIGLGLTPGDGIALLLENRPEFLELAEAARLAGLYYTPLSIHLRPQEVAYVLADSGAKLLIASPALAPLAARLLAEGVVGDRPCFALAEGLPGYASYEATLAAEDPAAPLPERPVGREFLYSSGTTGLPKGIRRPLIPYADRDKPEWDMSWKSLYGFAPETVYLSPAPLYHAAPNRYVYRTLSEGGTAVVMQKFDAARALALIAAHGVTHSQWVPTMFVRMLALPEAERRAHDLSSHRCAIHAAAPCPPAVKRAMIAWWGPILWEYYAGSEGIGTTVISSEEWLRKPGSVGRPVNGVSVHITGEDGAELPPGETGTIRFSGGPHFAYHNAPEKTAACYDERGWATLGDLGWKDEEGYLFLSDRRADLILSGGVNLYPAEIEAVLAQHPEVAEVAVVGVPQAEMGEQVHAVVVPRAGADAAALPAALDAWCRERLAGPKRPRSYELVEELPRSEAGKLLRRLLKEKYLPTG